MKKLLWTSLSVILLVSCQKGEISEISNKIKKADSLIAKTKNDIKSLDSIGKSINIDSINLPQILKEKENIEKIYKDNKSAIDSLASQIKDFGRNIDQQKVKEQLDSINQVLKKADAVINHRKNETSDRVENTQNTQQEPTIQERTIQEQKNYYPLEKSAVLEVDVFNLNDARDQLGNDLRNSNAYIVTENVFNNSEYKIIQLTAKVKQSQLDDLVNRLSNQLGGVRFKNIDVKGADPQPNAMSNIEISLYEPLKINAYESDSIQKSRNEEKSFGTKAMEAFGKGGEGFGNVLLFLLPFWPILLIAAIIFYFIRRNKKKTFEEKHQEEQFSQDDDEHHPESDESKK